jgi:hypothetical protein
MPCAPSNDEDALAKAPMGLAAGILKEPFHDSVKTLPGKPLLLAPRHILFIRRACDVFDFAL